MSIGVENRRARNETTFSSATSQWQGENCTDAVPYFFWTSYAEALCLEHAIISLEHAIIGIETPTGSCIGGYIYWCLKVKNLHTGLLIRVTSALIETTPNAEVAPE